MVDGVSPATVTAMIWGLLRNVVGNRDSICGLKFWQIWWLLLLTLAGKVHSRAATIVIYLGQTRAKHLIG